MNAASSPSINFSPVINQTVSPVLVGETAAVSGRPPLDSRPPAELTPNMVCVGIRTVQLFQSTSFVYSEAGEYGVAGDPAVIILLANRPASGQPGVAEAAGVKAQIVFRNPGGEIHSGFGAWVDHFSNTVDFSPGQLLKLILLSQSARIPGIVFGMTNSRSWNLPSRPWAAVRDTFERSPVNKMTVLGEAPIEIEITLLEDGRVLGVFSFAYSGQGDIPFTITQASGPGSNRA